MIVVRIIGGLGNQMFQYALGRHLSIRTGQSLRLDAHTPNANPLGIFDLDRFPIAGSRVSKLENRLLWRPLLKGAELTHRKSLELGGFRLLRETSPEFQPEILATRGDAYLAGYWQSERYFTDISRILREDFRLRDPPSETDRLLMNDLSSENSVCVHVRRGDYLALAAEHGICGADYYEAARDRMEQSLAAPRFYVFSDDHAWARATMGSWPRTQIVDHHPAAARHADLRLMTACRNFIVANSSFSWWAAWLSDAAGKVVIAPRRWFANPTLGSEQIVPGGWLRL